MREEDGAHVVGEAAVVLLRHRRVEAAEARLDVRDRNPELRRRERARERRVDVAGHDDERGLVLDEHRLDPDERTRRLLRVTA